MTIKKREKNYKNFVKKRNDLARVVGNAQEGPGKNRNFLSQNKRKNNNQADKKQTHSRKADSDFSDPGFKVEIFQHKTIFVFDKTS